MKATKLLVVLTTALLLLGFNQSYALSPLKQSQRSSLLTNNVDKNTILETAYPHTLSTAMAYIEPQKLDDYFKKLDSEYLAENVLGFIHPTIQFKNIQGEERYLVIVEKVGIYDGFIQGCRACSSTADFLLYKKQNNKFVLINSVKDQDQIPSANGHFSFNFISDLQKNLQPFGIDKMGSYTKATFTGAGGQEDSLWFAVLLPDVGKIQAVEIGSAGGSTESFYADRPEFSSSISSTLKILPNNSKYYPIEVTYTEKGKEKKPYKSIFNYSTQKAEYIEKKVK
ncbi:hypothetical protein ACDX34_03655 [Acinetobacter bereziniae]|uniref:hypothetical protein n=1 Tax=Acinetobacter bereziniae TaxID=106648 RepID=UPI0018FF4352|nr:hypothetical protein [Acinetobacter bereziniae]MBJ8450622.1 hypothetical protein [Acinetobacter bereziniae]MBJ8455436.1 hypothetical protein [Acinetobacter bereziniae]